MVLCQFAIFFSAFLCDLSKHKAIYIASVHISIYEYLLQRLTFIFPYSNFNNATFRCEVLSTTDLYSEINMPQFSWEEDSLSISYVDWVQIIHTFDHVT